LAIEGRLGNEPYYRYAEIAERGDNIRLDEWSPVELHVDDLPSHELDYLQVRFDMMGEGSVWLDDVAVFGMSFTRSEHHELTRVVGLADWHLREERLIECARTLSRFWPRFLLDEQAPEPRLASRANLPVVSTNGEVPENTEAGGDVSPLERIKKMVPRLPLR
jgi:hypothetical protein